MRSKQRRADGIPLVLRRRRATDVISAGKMVAGLRRRLKRYL
jgi:hypothetical protein